MRVKTAFSLLGFRTFVVIRMSPVHSQHVHKPCLPQQQLSKNPKITWAKPHPGTRWFDMPSRADLMQHVRSVAEGIMESLRLLLIVLMNSFELTNPNQEIPLEHVQQMNQLLTEVQGQRQRIEELTHLIQAAPVLSPSNRASQRGVPSPQPSISLDSEEEWDPVDLAETIARTPAPTQRVTTQVRGSQNQTFLPTSLNTGTRVGTQRASSTVVTATPTPTDGETGGPRSSTSIHNQETQLAIARTTLEQWGQKRVSWGKKHAGAKFTDVFEEDPGYLVWLRARAKTHTVQMTDFIAYCETRINMEQRALQRSRQ